MKLLTELDPNGSENQKAHRLRQRQYLSAGPNFCWHADGYEKLKPYGLSIQGCVDGFSSKMLSVKNQQWSSTSCIFLYWNSEENGIFTIVSWNRLWFWKWNNCRHSVLFTNVWRRSEIRTSVWNQRIGKWWSHLKKRFTNWLIECFKDLVNENIFIPGNQTHLECS